MNNKTKIFTFATLLIGCFVLVGRAEATTYYVRTDGGTATQCTGTTDAPYPGSGSNQACAFKHPFWAIAPQGNNPTKLVGGDTLIIDGSNSSQYMIGYGAPNTSDTSKCAAYYPWDCYMRPIPSGPDPAHPTRILGKGWDSGCSTPAQLWGTERVQYVLSLQGSNNVEVQCLEITDHSSCQDMGPASCNRNSAPYGAWSPVGIIASDSTNVLLKNVNIHGMAFKGIYAGRLTDWTLQNSKIVANSFVGWDGDIGAGVSSDSGTMMFDHVKIAYNGCGETYPGLQPYNCYSQDQGGYGDGLGTQLTSGNWYFYNSEISHNVSDGLDLLYHDGNGSVTIKRSRFEGNAGNQVKTHSNTTIENSVIIGNCSYFNNKSFTYNSASFNNCRAMGNALAIFFRAGTTASLSDSTLVGNNGDAIILSGGDGCLSSDKIVSRNNIFIGGAEFNSPGDVSNLYYASGATGNGDGTCGQLPLDDDYSVIYGTKYFSTDCNNRPHSKCQNPLLAETSTDPFYAGDAYNVNLQSTSPAKNAANVINGMSSLDYNSFDRGAQWDMGALEYGSVPPSGPAVCGNTVVESPEQCDDGNTTSGDGCSSSCQIELPPVCGNGIVEGTEQCDDGNLINGDGCNSSCHIETPAVCGNGIVENTEQCDDHNTVSGDGCSSTCQIETPVHVCGNGIVEVTEQCDDHNTLSGDGCSSTCQIETPVQVCGNGVVETPEQCDDHNTVSGDGCSSSCQLEAAVCGNGILQGTEQCDDGNTLNNDGCSSTCTTEAQCGNGIREGYEQCDDHNTVNGDGCSSTCTIEQVTYQLKLSYSADRSGATSIPSQVNATNIYIFTTPTTLVQQVKFYLDNVLVQTEGIAAYDFAGTAPSGNANPFNAASLGTGSHTIRADITRTDTLTASVSASFTVTASSQTIEAENFANKPVGGPVTGAWNIWSNGEISTPVALPAGNYRLDIRAKGQLAGSQNPNMRVKINGSTKKNFSVGSTSYSTYSVNVTFPQSTTLAIGFTNDYYNPPQDRNLIVDKVTVVPQ